MTPELDELLEEGAAEVVRVIEGVLPVWLRPLFPRKRATKVAVAAVHKLIADLTRARHLQITAPNVRVIVS